MAILALDAPAQRNTSAMSQAARAHTATAVPVPTSRAAAVGERSNSQRTPGAEVQAAAKGRSSAAPATGLGGSNKQRLHGDWATALRSSGRRCLPKGLCLVSREVSAPEGKLPGRGLRLRQQVGGATANDLWMQH